MQKVKSKSICMLAYKDLQRNTRIPRQVISLIESDFNVKVYCLGKPVHQLIPNSKNCEYIETGKFFFSILFKMKNSIIGFKNFLRRIKKTANIYSTYDHSSLKSNYEKSPYLFPLNYIVSSFFFKVLISHQPIAERIDFVQAHDSVTLRAAEMIMKKSGAKLIYDAIEIPYLISDHKYSHCPKYIFKNEFLFEKKLLTHAYRIFTVSNGLSNLIADGFNIPAPYVVKNCCIFDEEILNQTIKKDAGLGKNDSLIVYLNSIVYGRGLEQLIEAIQYLPSDMFVAILGPEPDKRYVEALKLKIEKLGVQKRICFLKMVDSDKVSSYVSGADIGIIPSQGYCLNIRHSLPNRLFQMIMARIPIALACLPDMKNLTQQYGIGKIFNEKNPVDIADVIKSVLKPVAYNQYKNAVKEASNELCWEKESEKYISSFMEKKLNEPF